MSRLKTAAASTSGHYLIREVQARDVESLYELAQHLDSVNLPHDRATLRAIVRRARSGFNGRGPPAQREYLFVMEAPSGKIVGTSMVFAQHGQPEAPHVFFDVVQDERYSSTLERHFSHTTLRLGFNYRGPTEIGALVLHPEVRALGLGKPLSFVRFLFIRMYRERFQDTVIAELMPPLLADGRSRLWEHLGRAFTGLSYQEADKLSHHDKEFIYALFPQSPLYATLLPADVRELIGQVGAETKGVKRMLESVGFRYSHRIDPFDGGPHFEARTDEIHSVAASTRRRVSREVLDDAEEQAFLARRDHPRLERAVVGTGRIEGPTRFRAAVVGVDPSRPEVALSGGCRKRLGVRTGGEVWVVTL